MQINNTAELRVWGVSGAKLEYAFKIRDNTDVFFNQSIISLKTAPSVFEGWLKPGVSTKTTSYLLRWTTKSSTANVQGSGP